MNYKVDHRYSLALFNASESLGCLDLVAGDAINLIELLKSERDLYLFFSSPVIRSEKKINVVKDFFKNKINDLTIDFIKLLILRNREGMIVNILNEFLNLKDKKEGFLKVNIKSAVKLDEKMIDKFKVKFNEFTNLKCKAETGIDENLIGGFTVQYEDTMVDASIKRQLELLKEKFKQ